MRRSSTRASACSLLPAAGHHVEQYAKIRSSRTTVSPSAAPADTQIANDETAQIVIGGLAFVQNLRRGITKWESTPCPRDAWPRRFGELAQAK
jgi:hypothetical protein